MNLHPITQYTKQNRMYEKKKSVVTEYLQQHFTVSMRFVQSNPVIRTTKHKKCQEKTTSTDSTSIEFFFS